MKWIVVVASATAITLAGCGTNESPSGSPTATNTQQQTSSTPEVTSTIASNLETPWGLGFLPDGTGIATERDTRKVLSINDSKVTTIGTIPEVHPEGEGGLLGVAVSPDFANDRTLFFYFTTNSDNRIAKATYRDGKLGSLKPIVTGIPSAFIHNGGRMTFGPDGYLYVGTGDAGEGELAQTYSSLGGKILRITKTGSAAPGNPRTGSRVWSLGHRNVQGLAFDDSGQLWASEFGQSNSDELNKIQKGGNYGWPNVEGKGGGSGYIDPELTWPVSNASPSGLAFANGQLWMASLRGERLWRITLTDGSATDSQDFFVRGYGRLRTVAAAPDRLLWVTTSNHDGRGDPASQDDRILAVKTTN